MNEFFFFKTTVLNPFHIIEVTVQEDKWFETTEWRQGPRQSIASGSVIFRDRCRNGVDLLPDLVHRVSFIGYSQHHLLERLSLRSGGGHHGVGHW